MTTSAPTRLPAVLEPGPAGDSLVALASDRPADWEPVLLEVGAILFRGFDVATREAFSAVTDAFLGPGRAAAYRGGVAPRGRVLDNIYQSTRAAPHLVIGPHNEMSYIATPPERLLFFCERPSPVGGETPITCARGVYRDLPPDLRDAFEERGVRYERFFPERSPARWPTFLRQRTWGKAFETDDRAEVERVCRAQGLEFRWHADGGLSCSNRLPAFRDHPATGERVWFNQATGFALGPDPANYRILVGERARFLASARQRWGRYLANRAVGWWRGDRDSRRASFGDGSPIPRRACLEVLRTMARHTTAFRWQAGDVLLVDNLLVAHGRMPFRGRRSILVSMA